MEARPPATTPAPSRLPGSYWRWAVGSPGATHRLPPVLLLILGVALLLRLYGVSWDQGSFFHPDERSIYMRADCMYRLLTEAPGYADCTRDAPFQNIVPGWPGPVEFLDADKSALNPHWFPLGTLIIYVLVGVKLLMAPIAAMDMQDLALVGRSLSAFADVGTVFMVFLLGRRLYGQTAGLLAAGLVTFAVVHIQIAHFYRPEPFTNLFTLAAFWFLLDLLDRSRIRDAALLGLFIGLAFATKISVLPLLLPLAVAFVVLYRRAVRQDNLAVRALERERWALRSLVTVAATAAIYLVTTPYALLDFPEFLGWTTRELDIVRQAGTVPYTMQYVGAPSLLYELRQTIVWGLGVPLGLLAWGGFFATVALNLRRPRLPQALLLLWAVPLLFTVTTVEVKFLRYTFPLMPVFIMMGSGLAVQAVRWLRLRSPLLGRAGVAAIALIAAATAFYGLAFANIYGTDHPAVQASRWINANVPHGASIVTDNHWDEGIPDIGRYRVSQIPIFEGDTIFKVDGIAARLADADYLVFYSKRTYGVIPRVPERYPYSARYYQALFSGELGFDLVQDFSRYPNLLGVAFADDTFSRAGLPVPQGLRARDRRPLTLNLGYADNDAVDYDRPLVLVFRNAQRYSAPYLLDLLRAQGGAAPGAQAPQLLLTPAELEAQRSGGTWTELFHPQSLANRLPVVAWLALVQAAALAVLPLAYVLFRGLHDRGYLLAKTLGLLLLTYLPWTAASIKLLPYERWTIYLAVSVIGLISSVVVMRRGHEITAFLRARWRILALEEALFLAAFLAFVAIRWANPDLWHPYRGGEKPMDLAYLTAIVRSSTMPPYDPWFAGGYLNYYYFGQFIIATLIKATGILPEIAYNLAVPLLFALTVGGAFSVAYNLAHALRARRAHRPGPRWGPAAAGVLAAFLAAIVGNMGSVIQLAVNVWRAFAADASLPPFDFWGPSRMMPGQIAINEFPFWTFLFADLHAHMIAIPVSLLVIGLGLNLVGVGEALGSWRYRGSPLPWRYLALPGGALALAIGSLAAINTWDYPSYLLFGAGAMAIACLAAYRHIAFAQAAAGTTPQVVELSLASDSGLTTTAADREPAPAEEQAPALIWGTPAPLVPSALLREAAGAWLWRTGALLALSYALFLPFHAHNVAYESGVHASQFQTHPLHYLAIYALPLFTVASFLLYQGRSVLRRAVAPLRVLLLPVAQPFVADAASAFQVNWGVLAVAAGLALILAYVLAAGYVTVALLLLLTAVALVLVVRYGLRPGADTPYQLFLLVLLAGALSIGIVVDLLTVNNDIDRMNTVFKLGLEAWVLFGLFSAVVIWHMATLRFAFPGGMLVKGLWYGLLALLVLSAAVFPVLGTRARLADRFSTGFQGLNGAQFVQTATYSDANGPIELKWDWDAIQWLRQNVQGSPVVAEGSTDPHNYRWGGRVSVYTGLPSIVGWGWHQSQQRTGEQDLVRQRLRDVRTLYSTTSAEEAEGLLRKYDVRYIYVGELERLYYPAEGLAKFDDMLDRGLLPAYSNERVKIYGIEGVQ